MRSGLYRAPWWVGWRPSIVAALVLAFAVREERGASAQQQADSAFVPHVEHPAFRQRGPRVLIDEAHKNFHTAGGRYRPFAELLAPGARVLLALGPEAFDHPSPTAAQAASEAEPGMAWMTAVAGLPTRSAGDRAMAVALRFGSGRVAVFGEAAMFTAQTITETAGTRQMGMGASNDNEKLALNVVHWLAGLLPAP
jgi:hypothetical protein